MTLNNPRLTTSGAFQFSFSSTTGGVFSVLAATNLSVPVSNWVMLGTASETPPGSGQFQFTDPQSTNGPRQFYRLRWP